MSDALNIFSMIYDFVKNTTILSFAIGEAQISITFLQVLIGCIVVSIGIDVIRHLMGFE